MPTLDDLDISDLNELVNSKVRKNSTQYISRVKNESRQGDVLRADVQGTHLYNVEILATELGIEAICTCPYNWDGYCKHIGAVLLKWIISSHSFTVEKAAPKTADNEIEAIPVAAVATFVPEELPTWLTLSYKELCKQYNEIWQEWLQEYKVQELRQIASKQGWSIKGIRKDDIIQQLMEQMLQPGVFLKSLMRLNNEHLQVYQAMAVLYPGVAYDVTYLKALAEQWGKLTKYKDITTYTNRICDLGFAVPFNQRFGYYNRIPFIPASIWRVLPPLLAERVPEADLPTHSDSEVRLASPKSFLQRFQQVLLLLEQSQPPLRPPMPRPRLEKYHEFLQKWDSLPEEIYQAQQERKLSGSNTKLDFTIPPPKSPLPDEAIERLSPIAGGEAQLNFIYHLLATVGLLQPGSPITVWREVKEQFFRLNEAEQWAIILDAYFEMTWWNEVWLVLAEQPALQLKRAKTTNYLLAKLEDFYGILAVFRTQIVHLLAFLKDNRWYGVDELSKLLRLMMPRFDSWCWSQVRYSSDIRPGWFVTENGRTLETSTDIDDWEKTHGAFFRQVIQGPLHWLGVADVTFEHRRLSAFRLHGLHDLYLNKVESVPLASVPAEGAAVTTPPLAEPITIENRAIVVNPTAVSAQVHNYFDSIARLETADPAKFIYRLDAAAVHQSFEAGQTLDQMVEGWQKWLGVSMPELIFNKINGWWEAYGRVRLYDNITVIEFSDDYALAEMKATTSLEKHLIAEISPKLIIIQESAISELVSELEKAGYTPKQANDDN